MESVPYETQTKKGDDKMIDFKERAALLDSARYARDIMEWIEEAQLYQRFDEGLRGRWWFRPLLKRPKLLFWMTICYMYFDGGDLYEEY